MKGVEAMTSPVVLTDAEAALVSGGAIFQTITISASQRNTSSVSEIAVATNSGRVTATASGVRALAAAVGAEASNTAAVIQASVVETLNIVRFGP
jgi:hypothetical protein